MSEGRKDFVESAVQMPLTFSDFSVGEPVFSVTGETTVETPVEAMPVMEMGETVWVENTRAEQNLSLPAALCDDQLLQEIAQIPDRMGFKIGDVAELLGIKPYVLRYWETEFEVLKPKKANNNQRYYTKKHVENAFLIRKLLHRDRFSIEGARSALKDLKTVVRKEREWSSVHQKVDHLQERLDHLLVDIKQLRQLFV